MYNHVLLVDDDVQSWSWKSLYKYVYIHLVIKGWPIYITGLVQGVLFSNIKLIMYSSMCSFIVLKYTKTNETWE